jgi:hypothetical protein
MITATVTVGSTATRLVGNGAPVPGGQRTLIKNTHATDKLIIGGSSGVAANNGFGIDAGQTLDIGVVEVVETVWAIRGASADIGAQVLTRSP